MKPVKNLEPLKGNLFAKAITLTNYIKGGGTLTLTSTNKGGNAGLTQGDPDPINNNFLN